MSLLYLKLVSAEEIVGHVEKDETTGMLKVSDPLQFECGIDDTDPNRRYVFMARFAPFVANNEFLLDPSKIVFQGPPSEVVAKYYDVSLNYCRSSTDVSFSGCVVQTTNEIAMALKGPDRKKAEELLEKLIVNAPSPSKGYH
jgi:hypothetical protein